MELEFTLEKSDLIALAKFTQKTRARSLKAEQAKFMWGFVGVVSALVVVGGVIAVTGSFGPLLMAGGILLSVLLFAKMYLKWFLNTYYSERFFPDMFILQKMIFTEESLTNIRQTCKAEFAWNAFKDIVHAEKHTYFVLPSFTGSVLPHRIFR